MRQRSFMTSYAMATIYGDQKVPKLQNVGTSSGEEQGRRLC
jgi:hypothetical protein